MTRRPTFVLKLLRGTGIHGLRAILKRLLRSHGFKCISAKEIPAQQESPPDGSGQ